MALIEAASAIMTEKGVDATTMLEIAERADVGAGTVYNYFKSKDDLALAVLENLMHILALRIEQVTNRFDDPEQVYAFGIRTVLDEATDDPRWQQLLHRSEVIADTAYRVMGPFATRDMRQAEAAGRFRTPDPDLIWRLTTQAIMGAALAMSEGRLTHDCRRDIIVRLLCMTGIGLEGATELAARDRPPLPGKMSSD
ncbi:TetR/AcrR family transcriptional regulator [Celeribacter baekdonensis]|uniref:TetR/AcrR family transcriptional regulator n=1 Tax=Celeribacter baekdonensis TaxID=875171 RepID=UPI0020C7FA93|nr:TetR/AcrR family transcriptional regulator [Celeribacter baekdonensis]